MENIIVDFQQIEDETFLFHFAALVNKMPTYENQKHLHIWNFSAAALE